MLIKKFHGSFRFCVFLCFVYHYLSNPKYFKGFFFCNLHIKYLSSKNRTNKNFLKIEAKNRKRRSSPEVDRRVENLSQTNKP